MVRIKLISINGESDKDSNNYFKGFVDEKPVFSTIEEAKIMSTETEEEDNFTSNMEKLRKDFKQEDKKYIPEEV